MTHDSATAIVAAAAALLGAVGQGAWGWLRGRGEDAAVLQTARIKDGAEIRDELWAEIDKLRSRVDLMQTHLDTSRREFLQLLEEHTTLKGEYKALKHEHDTLLVRYAGLERRIDNV